jgi:hypothetical protein
VLDLTFDEQLEIIRNLWDCLEYDYQFIDGDLKNVKDKENINELRR